MTKRLQRQVSSSSFETEKRGTRKGPSFSPPMTQEQQSTIDFQEDDDSRRELGETIGTQRIITSEDPPANQAEGPPLDMSSILPLVGATNSTETTPQNDNTNNNATESPLQGNSSATDTPLNNSTATEPPLGNKNNNNNATEAPQDSSATTEPPQDKSSSTTTEPPQDAGTNTETTTMAPAGATHAVPFLPVIVPVKSPSPVASVATPLPTRIQSPPPDATPTKPHNSPLQNKKPYPPSSPTTTATISPAVTTCQAGEFLCHPFVVGTLIVLLGMCCVYRCKRRRADMTRGEYRAVAAHYTTNTFDDTFADNVSPDEMYDDDDEDDDDDEYWNGGGSSRGGNNHRHKRTIEMSSLEDGEENGGLTLEEMNG